MQANEGSCAVRGEGLKLALLCLGLLALVQPGAVAFANFDAPYGFMVDLAAWLSAFVGASPIIFGYLAWRRGAFGLKGIAAFAGLILALALLIYAIQERYYASFRAQGYRPPAHLFLASFILSAVLALMILPVALLHLPQVYSYDPAMGAINLAVVGLMIALGALRLKNRGRGVT